MKTTAHAYRFDISQPTQKAAWEELRAKLRTDSPHRMKFLTMERSYWETGRMLDGQEIELEAAHLFDNQWNTAPIEGVSDLGLRVFDWAQDVFFDYKGRENKIIKQGYYLDQTAEMREIRRNTAACGYCGKREPAAKGYVFCPHCLDSEHLKEEYLHMTRMRPVEVDRFAHPAEPLTEAEAAHLLPLYKEAQLHGSTERGKARIAKQKADIETEYTKTVANATEKRDAARWLAARIPGVMSNWIFYTHTGKHTFGWRSPVSPEVEAALLLIISEFPFPYEIKCADGRSLTAE